MRCERTRHLETFADQVHHDQIGQGPGVHHIDEVARVHAFLAVERELSLSTGELGPEPASP